MGDGLLVPAALGGIARKGRKPRGRDSAHGPDPGGRARHDRSALAGSALHRRPNDKVFTFWAVEKFPDPGKIPNTRMDLPAFDYLRGQTLAKLIDAERRATAAAMAEVC